MVVSVDTGTRSKLTALELVYPPISNQEAVWLQHDPEVEVILRESDFYMIAGRAEARFLDLIADPKTGFLTFQVKIGDDFSDAVEVHVRELPAVLHARCDAPFIEAGEKIVRIWDRPLTEPDAQILDWFTTEKLIWERSRGKRGIAGFDKFREAATYDLLYVGIAKVGDSFDRLINKGHKARMEILANEPQRYPGSRVTDETYLFMFRVSPLVIQTFSAEHQFQEKDLDMNYEHKRIVADAEKAFVSLLKPGYNVVKFAGYPKGADGLHGREYARYAYVIGENLTYNTAHGRIKGGRDLVSNLFSNHADCIFVEGNGVKLFIAGEDWPIEKGEHATGVI